MGNPNLVDTRIKQSKFFSISKAKREFQWTKGEGADSGKYSIKINEMSSVHTKRRGQGAAWGKAERKFDHTPSDLK